jgi:tetratricopeptide (TPR) repeat protein
VRRETEHGIESSVTLHGSEEEAWLDRGRQMRAETAFDEAADLFRQVYELPSADQEHRAAALLELGLVHSDLLNPKKDHELALEYLRKLVDTYPDSEYREEAEQKIADIQELKTQQP